VGAALVQTTLSIFGGRSSVQSRNILADGGVLVRAMAKSIRDSEGALESEISLARTENVVR
jgi:hypothetical protein